MHIHVSERPLEVSLLQYASQSSFETLCDFRKRSAHEELDAFNVPLNERPKDIWLNSAISYFCVMVVVSAPLALTRLNRC